MKKCSYPALGSLTTENILQDNTIPLFFSNCILPILILLPFIISWSCFLHMKIHKCSQMQNYCTTEINVKFLTIKKAFVIFAINISLTIFISFSWDIFFHSEVVKCSRPQHLSNICAQKSCPLLNYISWFFFWGILFPPSTSPIWMRIKNILYNEMFSYSS